MIVTFYNPANGEILKTISCLDSEIAENQPIGASYIEGRFDGRTHKIIDGFPVEKEPEPEPAIEIDIEVEMRRQRNSLLRATDWTQMPDAPLTEQQRTAWAIYRQSLRDVPQNNANVASLDEVQWPSKPEA